MAKLLCYSLFFSDVIISISFSLQFFFFQRILIFIGRSLFIRKCTYLHIVATKVYICCAFDCLICIRKCCRWSKKCVCRLLFCFIVVHLLWFCFIVNYHNRNKNSHYCHKKMERSKIISWEKLKILWLLFQAFVCVLCWCGIMEYQREKTINAQ